MGKLTVIGQTIRQVGSRVRHGALTRHLIPVRQTTLPIRQAEALRWTYQTALGAVRHVAVYCEVLRESAP